MKFIRKINKKNNLKSDLEINLEDPLRSQTLNQ